METKSSQCGCISHTGPHWLYMDFLDRERNLQHIEQAVRCAESRSWQQFEMALYVYMQEDQAGLKEKQYCMQREDAIAGGAREYPYSLLGIDERVECWEQRHRALWGKLKSLVAIPIAS